MHSRRVLVVIPAFNEEEALPAVIAEVRQKASFADVVVVDDGSVDATATRAREAGATVIALPFNLGVGGAMRAGFRYARQEGYDAVVQVDADGQHDPANLREMLAALESADVVLGARFAGKGEYSVRGPRRWAMVFLAWALSRICRARLTDATSGFRMCGPDAIEVFAEDFPAEYLGDTVEALVIAAKSGLTVSQVPVAMRERQGGTPSHPPFKAMIYLGRAVLALVFALMRPKSTARKGTS